MNKTLAQTYHTLMAIIEEHCQEYLKLYEECLASVYNIPFDNSLDDSNNGYFVGTGIDLEIDLEEVKLDVDPVLKRESEKRLNQQFNRSIIAIKDAINQISTLNKNEKNQLLGLINDNMCWFCTNPSQEKIPTLMHKLTLAMKKHVTAAKEAQTDNIHQACSMFPSVKRQKQDEYTPLASHTASSQDTCIKVGVN